VCIGLFEELVQSWQQRQVTDDVDAQMHPAESLGYGHPTIIEWVPQWMGILAPKYWGDDYLNGYSNSIS
jgi:hypothetical protein